MSETNRKVKKVIHLRDEEEMQRRYAEYVETPIVDTDHGFFRVKEGGGRLFLDPLTQEPILPSFRIVKCRCKRKLKIFLVSKDPIVYAAKCGRCKGAHFIGDVEAIKKATRKQRREWLRKAKKLGKKKGYLFPIVLALLLYAPMHLLLNEEKRWEGSTKT